jgi:hypothetical protein
MIAAIASMAIAAVVGFAIVMALDPGARGSRLAALCFPIGLSACALALGGLSALGLAWTRALVFAAVGILFLVAAAAAMVRRRGAGAIVAPDQTPRSVVAWIGGVLVAGMLAGHALFVTLAPPGEWDFWAIWGLKAKVFHAAEGIDWEWLERPANEFAHPDYPVLLPLAYDYLAVTAGRFPEKEIGLLFTALAGSILLLAASHLREASGSPTLAMVGAVALTGPVLTLDTGLADLPLLVFGTIALLELRSALIDRREQRVAVAAAALVLAVLTKNEGISLAVAAGLAILVAGGPGRWTMLRAVAPAGMVAFAWIALRRAHGLGTDLFAGDAVARLASASPGEVLGTLARHPPDYPLFWLATAIAIIAGGSRRLVRERWILLALALQLAFFLGAYLVTPRDLEWHVATSWPRLLSQLVVPMGFVAVMFAGESLGSVMRGLHHFSSAPPPARNEGADSSDGGSAVHG